MGRWEPDARGRLGQAAMELYVERGFDRVTVTDIAERAGLTKRTFFRHFADKREVLFDGAGRLQDALVSGVEQAPADLSPLDAVARAVEAVGGYFEAEPEAARRRFAVITANAELRERELIKMSTLAAAVAEVLRRRGVGDPGATLAAEAGIAVFRVAFDRWVAPESHGEFAHHVRTTLAELKAVAAG